MERKINFVLPDTENIMVKASFRDLDYDLPALPSMEEGEEEIFRIPHTVLKAVRKDIQTNYPDVILNKGFIETASGNVIVPDSGQALSYSKTVVQIKTSDQDIVQYGEVNLIKKGMTRFDAIMNCPFKTAMRYAHDGAMIELLGLPSQMFYKDGSPAIYQGMKKPEVKQIVPPQDPLTADEKAELTLCEKATVPFNKDGKTEMIPIGTLQTQQLEILLNSTSAHFEAARNTARRMLELRKKQAEASDYQMASR